MSADEEAKRMIREAIAEGWRRLWHELGAQCEAMDRPQAERSVARVLHHDADLITFFDELEAAQQAARAPRRTRLMRALLNGPGGGVLLAGPTLAEQRALPN